MHILRDFNTHTIDRDIKILEHFLHPEKHRFPDLVSGNLDAIGKNGHRRTLVHISKPPEH